ncbi:MAG: acetyl-CoA carboxylase biotin carboxylase subunit, partial [Armatimonadetes bacterium]|nr:acetyl-CoA carboxylase biotin carboxylase subunit [Armatimonadota bacterium]
MFERILVANRGEIACRVIQACRELGIATIAVYSEADADAVHTHMADEAVCIGPPPNVDSYLNAANILSAAIITGADAIHPGYGNLSEDAHFAEACEACKIKFIGPPAEAIARVGDKNEARRTVREAGVW